MDAFEAPREQEGHRVGIVLMGLATAVWCIPNGCLTGVASVLVLGLDLPIWVKAIGLASSAIFVLGFIPAVWCVLRLPYARSMLFVWSLGTLVFETAGHATQPLFLDIAVIPAMGSLVCCATWPMVALFMVPFVK